MDVLVEDIICIQCNQKMVNYSNQLCRKQFLTPTRYSKTRSVQINEINIINDELIDNKTSGNFILDEFIKETQLNSKYCDDFIEWIPLSNLEDVKYSTNGGNSKIYFGTWNLLLNMSLASMASKQFSSSRVALKVINDFDNVNDHILNELKIHHKCRNPRVVPFYGITKAPKGNEYAMVIRLAKHGDLRNYIHKFFPKLTWADRAKILIELSKALNSLHQMNLIHRDFHCKNILVDENDRIFISDFGLCQPIDSEIVSNSIQGVLPYIAPEVLRNNPYTKQSEVYSLSMIMWELTSNKPPFSNNQQHDIYLAFAILDGLRPEIIEGTPDFYADIMKQCWNSDPSKRPDASLLPELFEEMMKLCKMFDDDTFSSNIAFCSSLPQSSNSVTNDSDEPGYVTSASDLGLNMTPTYHHKEENKNNSAADTELLSQPNPITNLNENSVQPKYETRAFDYTLEGQLYKNFKT
ncbi:kinase-like domain-containing protein [Rhizophagus clarus]|uniref:Kinase-like domain-containing protein n=1 Tax=Rhizophagus clarus TaxID=94130 RepID=A0A8H3QG84_9GLOM|nr:kinase-like domain-containing protein [Rhizophagus clarus]